MEFYIPDLLDPLQDESVSIRPCADVSTERIRAMTMKKVRKQKKGNYRGISAIMKIAAVAAVLTALVIPVMAATGFRFADWYAGLGKLDLEEDWAQYTSWENTEGFWQIGLKAKEQTGEGMTLVVREEQDSPVTGKLVIHGDYWLEKWNGEAFVAMTPAAEVPVEESREIRDGDSFEMEIDWSDTYGLLESGRYRLGKNFTYTYSDGKTVELHQWAEFRIFNGDMQPYVSRCINAMEALRQQEHYHTTWTVVGYFEREVWKSGEDYLMRQHFSNERLGNGLCYGELLRSGEGFSIWEWNGEDIQSGVKDWEYDELLSDEINNFDSWNAWLDVRESNVGEIWVEGNQIGLLSTRTSAAPEVYHDEEIFTFDAAGKLTSVALMSLPELGCSEEEKHQVAILEVHNTSPEEIKKVLESQNVGTPAAFSWEEEKQASGTGVKTSGFQNTAPVSIGSGYDAFMAAQKDYEAISFHASLVSRDEEADMWKVDFWWKNGNVHTAVYLDGQGITRMTFTEPYAE